MNIFDDFPGGDHKALDSNDYLISLNIIKARKRKGRLGGKMELIPISDQDMSGSLNFSAVVDAKDFYTMMD